MRGPANFRGSVAYRWVEADKRECHWLLRRCHLDKMMKAGHPDLRVRLFSNSPLDECGELVQFDGRPRVAESSSLAPRPTMTPMDGAVLKCVHLCEQRLP